jgi:hypothetical protein
VLNGTEESMDMPPALPNLQSTKGFNPKAYDNMIPILTDNIDGLEEEVKADEKASLMTDAQVAADPEGARMLKKHIPIDQIKLHLARKRS